MSKFHTVTVATITVEIVGSSYGPEWVLGDIIKQASDELPQVISNILGIKARVIGQPSIKTVTVLE